MKKTIFFFALLFGSVPTVFAQAVNSLTGQPARPGYANFHSNLGFQKLLKLVVKSRPEKLVLNHCCL